MPRKPQPKNYGGSSAQACPESLDLRPDTGLSFSEQEQARRMVRQLIRERRDGLPPKAKLTEAQKREVYADAARMMTADCKRPVSADQVTLTVATIRAQVSNPSRYTVRVLKQHHALVEAEAEAEGIAMMVVAQRAFDAYFELDPLDR